jgi:hypothetical protein
MSPSNLNLGDQTRLFGNKNGLELTRRLRKFLINDQHAFIWKLDNLDIIIVVHNIKFCFFQIQALILM